MSEIKAAGYVRVSTDEQAREGLSLDAQKKRVKEHIESEGWTLTEIYVEAGVSGRRDDRPELNRLLGSLGEIDRLVIPKLDRLGRNVRHMVETYDRLEAAKVELVSLGENIDTSTPMGKTMRLIMSALAELESATTGERVKSVVVSRASQGKHHAQWPYGYEQSVKARADKKGKKGGKVIEPAASIVQRIWNESAEGESQLNIARKLNQEGIRSPKGGEWRQSRIRAILDNVTYLGKIETNGVIYDGEHDALITQELWDKVQALRQSRKRDKSGGSRGRRPKRHLFSHGLLRCAHCDGAMLPHTPTRGGGAERYECATKRNSGPAACIASSVPRDLLDTAVFDYFQRVAVDLDATKQQLLDSASARNIEASERLTSALHDETKADEAVKRVRGDYTAGEITAAEWRELRPDLESSLAAATAEREQLQRQVDAAAADTSTLAELDSAAVKMLASVRDEIAGEVTSASGIESVRASLSRLFDRFEVARVTADGSALSDAEREVMQAQAREYDDEVLEVGRWVIVPVPREEWAGELAGYRQVLLGPEPLSIKEPSGNPGGYCGLGGTGVSCPIGLATSSRDPDPTHGSTAT